MHKSRELGHSPAAPYPNPQLIEFLIRLGQWKDKVVQPTEFFETAESGAWEMEAVVPKSRLKGDPLGGEVGRRPAHWMPLCRQPRLS